MSHLVSFHGKSFFSQINVIEMGHRQGNKKHIYVDIDGKYESLKQNDPSKNLRKKLSFREIFLLSYHHQESVSEQNLATLRRMSIQKLINDDKRNLFVRLAMLIFDYGRNWYGGYGLKSSTSLAFAFIEANSKNFMEKQSSPISTTTKSNSVIISPSPTTVEKRISELKQEQNKVQNPPKPELERKVTKKIDSNSATTVYLNNPDDCDKTMKSSVLQHISVGDALKLFNQLSTIEKQRLMIYDMLTIGNKERLSEFVKHLDLSLETLGKCFEKISEIANKEDGDIIRLYFMDFLKIYDDKYLSSSRSNDKDLPVTHRAVVAIFCIALNKFHYYENQVLKYLDKLLNKEEFNIEVFLSLIKVFKDKKEAQHGADSVYKSKENLVNHFNNSPQLQEAFKHHRDYDSFKSYLEHINCKI